MKAKTKPRQNTGLGVLGLLLATAVLMGLGLFLKDARQIPFGSFGGLVWGTVVVASFLFGLIFFAQYVLPLRGSEGWSEGLRLLWRHYSLSAEHFMNNRFAPSKAGRHTAGQSKPSSPDLGLSQLAPSFTRLGAGIVKSHQVLALARGNQFTRPAGPGFVLLFKKEIMAQVIDLRKHSRKQAVAAYTRDGISLATSVSVSFRVRQSSLNHLDDNIQYPYDKEAIFHVSHATSVGARGKIRPWTEQLCPRAATLLTDELSRYSLDELYRADEAGMALLNEIKQRIKRQLERMAESDGIEIMGVGIGPLKPPQTVIDQRFKLWQAEWQRKIAVQHAADQAEALRRIQKARARAQIKIIENITRNIEVMRRAENADLTEIITLRMIDALEEATSNTSVQSLIPQQVLANLVLDASAQLQAWTNRPPEERDL